MSIKQFPIEHNQLCVDLYNSLEKIKGMRENKFPDRLFDKRGKTLSWGCGYRRQRGFSDYDQNLKYPEIYELLKLFATYIGCKAYQTITVNKNVYMKRHTDKSNSGDSYITSLGNFSGGGLFVDEKLYSLKNNVLVFNGFDLAHETEQFVGTRYTLIFYNQVNKSNKSLSKKDTDEELEELVQLSLNSGLKYEYLEQLNWTIGSGEYGLFKD